MGIIGNAVGRAIFGQTTWDELNKQFLRGDDHPSFNGEMVVTEESALKYSAVLASIRVLSETLASVPLMVYQKTEDGRILRDDLDIYDILHSRPNSEMTAYSFKEAGMMSLNTGGNMVCEKQFNIFGDLVGLYPYRWGMVDIERNPETNKLEYHIGRGADKKILTRDQVFHVPGLSFDGVIGISPIEYAMQSIKLGKSYEQFGINFYKNGANSSGVFSFEGELNDTSYARLKADVAKNYAGLANTGRPIVLEEGGTFTPVQIKPIDAQLIENKKFQIEDIARIYRVPLHLIQNLDHATFSNIEHQSLEFIMYTMLPWFKRIEEAANTQLLSKTQRKLGIYVEAKIDVLLRGDIKTRAESYARGRQWGWLSVNDIRRLENLPSIPNGNIYLQPINMVEAGGELTAASAKMTDDIYSMLSSERR